MKFPNSKLLVYVGIADAYASGAEYIKPSERVVALERCLKFQEYVPHPIHPLAPGAYTDDTEMSIANAHVLLAYGAPYTRLQFADAYVAEFARGGKRSGYASRFQRFLEEVKSGEELL